MAIDYMAKSSWGCECFGLSLSQGVGARAWNDCFVLFMQSKERSLPALNLEKGWTSACSPYETASSSLCHPMWPCEGTCLGQGTPGTSPQAAAERVHWEPRGWWLYPSDPLWRGKGLSPPSPPPYVPHTLSRVDMGQCWGLLPPGNATAVGMSPWHSWSSTGPWLCEDNETSGVLIGRIHLGASRCFLKKLESFFIQYLVWEGEVVLGEVKLELLAVLWHGRCPRGSRV